MEGCTRNNSSSLARESCPLGCDDGVDDDDSINSLAGEPCPLGCDGSADDNGNISSSSPEGASSPIGCDNDSLTGVSSPIGCDDVEDGGQAAAGDDGISLLGEVNWAVHIGTYFPHHRAGARNGGTGDGGRGCVGDGGHVDNGEGDGSPDGVGAAIGYSGTGVSGAAGGKWEGSGRHIKGSSGEGTHAMACGDAAWWRTDIRRGGTGNVVLKEEKLGRADFMLSPRLVAQAGMMCDDR
uniref:Glycine rich protein n=1 Tax=Oryza sativa subsp. japonica TaxID=39947 RepID=Q6AVL7_ORYSJ|nr:putative glycine rich protein [Oryza sativa Japonica Group]